MVEKEVGAGTLKKIFMKIYILHSNHLNVQTDCDNTILNVLYSLYVVRGKMKMLLMLY